MQSHDSLSTNEANQFMRMVITRSLVIPTVAILAGCSLKPVQAGSQTPIPQALIQAAERASESNMVMADIMARSHKMSVDEARLDLPDSQIPGFMKQRVRLDYNGPMSQVLDRLSTDLGFRVAEYNGNPSGPSWQPWVRLHGDKQLVQHVREMNSQIPWHLVMDYRNRRVVVDYSADGSMASQVKAAQDRMQAPGAGMSGRNLPDISSMQNNADNSVTQQVVASPATPKTQPTTNAAPQSALPPTPRQPSMTNSIPDASAGYWYAGVSGYQTKERAEQMRQWLKANDYLALIAGGENDHEVQVPAANDVEASTYAEDLVEQGVPAKVGYVSAASSASIIAANSSGQSEASAPEMPAATATALEQRVASTSASSQPMATRATERDQATRTASANRQSATTNPEQGPRGETLSIEEDQWYLQVSYLNSMKASERVIDDLIDDYRINRYPYGKGYLMRIGPFDERSDISTIMREVRADGYPDAYPVEGSNV